MGSLFIIMQEELLEGFRLRFWRDFLGKKKKLNFVK